MFRIWPNYYVHGLLYKQLTEADQELYKNFPLVVSERWQQEVAETVFETINADTDKIEQKKKNKPRIDEMEENCKCYLGNSVTFF